VKIKRLSFLTNEIKQALKISLDGNENFFEEEIKKNICELWNINEGESFCISRMEEENNNTILVLCCFAGKNLDGFAQHVMKIADKNSWFIRVHTKNKALVRWYLRRYNFNLPEYVLIRGPKNG
jgi:hypothetical protein